MEDVARQRHTWTQQPWDPHLQGQCHLKSPECVEPHHLWQHMDLSLRVKLNANGTL